MRKSILFLSMSILIIWVSCSGIKEPEFRKMQNVWVEEATINEIRISAEAVCYNPNVVGILIDHSDVEVTANGISIGQIQMTNSSRIFSKSEFSIPIEVSFPPSRLLDNESGFLGGILVGYLNKKIELKFTGHVTTNVGGITFDIPLEYEETVDLTRQK